ncbi:MAG: hypothetical protein H6772_02085 [Pseudomonadales bacterium]|nr:hypothetical protein [Pseudomonadales bacterium]
MSKENTYQELLNQIEELVSQQEHVVVVLDGRSGVGKSSIAEKLFSELDAVIIKVDDFYTGPPEGKEANWNNKTAKEKVDTVLDYKRLEEEALIPLLSDLQATYHPFDFENGEGLSAKVVELNPRRVVVVDGVYSADKLAHLADISVLVQFPDESRRKRLLKREGEVFMTDWHRKWDEAENYYFDKIQPKNSFDIIIEGKV